MSKFLFAQIHVASWLYSSLPVIAMLIGVIGIRVYETGPIWFLSMTVIGYGWIVIVSRLTHRITRSNLNKFT